jgi:hypothetical protein
MKNLGCIRFQEALDGRASRLTNASRLALEEHLASCESCRKDAAAIDRLRSLADDLPDEISSTRRMRAIRNALATDVRALPSEPRRTSKRIPWALAGGLAAAAAVLLGVGAVVLSQSTTELAESKEGAPKVELPEPVEEAPAPSHVIAAAGARHVYGAATIDLPNGGEFRYDDEARRLTLVRGFLRVEVDPARHASFRVDTPRFSVLVLGTIFEVDERQVRVIRGAVKVVAPDERVLVERLKADQTWLADLEPVAQAEVEGDTSPEHARRLLARAREQTAAGDYVAAQRTIQAALEAPHGPREAAGAATLRAAIARNRGDLETAFRGYRDVARRYSRLPEGESALFAAARIAVQRGDRASARQLFDDYLQRYPSGRYRSEVLRNREALGL